MGSEVEQVDEILRGEGHGAVFWVVCCAGMILKRKGHFLIDLLKFLRIKTQTKMLMLNQYLPEKDVAVRAEVQGVAVLLSLRIAAAQLKVHFLPLQVAFVRQHQTLANLKTKQGRNERNAKS